MKNTIQQGIQILKYTKRAPKYEISNKFTEKLKASFTNTCYKTFQL